MTHAELLGHLQDIGLPLRYHHFSSPPEPPYLVFFFSYSGDLIADNINYAPASNYQIELYTNKKDLASETLVENRLKEIRLPYLKTETWLESEGLYQIIYEVKLF